jgi:amino acid transporter
MITTFIRLARVARCDEALHSSTGRVVGQTGTRRRVGAGTVLKRVLVGRRAPTYQLEHTLLPKVLALPIFTADALSSVAYCVEASMVVLIAAGVAALHYVIGIQIAVALLMAIVVASYRQVVRAYRTSGGAYIVAKENLGVLPSLVAAASLLIDYVLTVAVSVASGVLAITSAAPSLHPYRLEITIFFIFFIAVINLRGVREAGMAFALPTYGFIASMFLLLLGGFVRCLSGCPHATVPNPIPAGTAAVSLFLILRAFASGASALTGTEAISNAVTAFRRPQWRNAADTLLALGVIGISLILGTAILAVQTHARPSLSVSMVSEIARAVFPSGSFTGFMFYVIQIFTFAVLILAANTSYQGFPRLMALLAQDRFVPRQFRNLGDRLVFSNGVVVLAVVAALLVWAFDANVDKLIQLYVLGVFTAFTLSQAGMVRHWMKVRSSEREEERRGWRRAAFINAVGAVATGIVAVVVLITKFTHGLYIVVIAVPIIVATFYGVRGHYRTVSAQLRQRKVQSRTARNSVVLLVRDIDAATAEALGYVRAIRSAEVHAVHLSDNGFSHEFAERWHEFTGGRLDLEPLPAKGSSLDRVRAYLEQIPRESGDFVTVTVPELLPKPTLGAVLRHPELLRLKAGLLRERRIAVTDVPVVLSEEGEPVGVDSLPLHPLRTVALVFVSGVHDATVRAVNYARSLNAQETRAVFFALDPPDAAKIADEWVERGLTIPLEITDAPFRDLSGPMRDEVRRITARPDTIAAVVIPELVPKSWRHYLLHRQTALFVKRLLLFEERVILTSVPYQLG